MNTLSFCWGDVHGRTADLGRRPRRVNGGLMWHLLLSLGAVVLLDGAALGSDGVKQLKQPPAFPLVISQAGSYRLRTNITVPDANTTAIQITASDVTLDLYGFTISGPTACGGHPQVCAPSGSGVGIVAAGPENVTILNGTVRGMGNRAIYMSEGRVERVTVTNNGGNGIDIADGTVVGCTVRQNGGEGVLLGDGFVTGSRLEENGFNGIEGNGNALGNFVATNGQKETGAAGISMTSGVIMANTVRDTINGFGIFSNGVVVNNDVFGSGTFGILLGDGTAIGNTANVNGQDGIRFSGGGVVANNAAFNNTGFGLNLGAGSGYTDDALNGNTAGTVSGGLAIGTNVCNASTTCP